MSTKKLLENGIVWFAYALVFTVGVWIFLPMVVTLEPSQQKTLDHIGVLAKTALMVMSVAFGVVQIIQWFIVSGRDQTNKTAVETTQPNPSITRRVFRFRSYAFWGVFSWIWAGIFLVPLLAVLPLILLTKFGTESGLALLAIGVAMSPIAWLLWRLGKRYANGGVTIDGNGVEVRSTQSNGRFAWGEIGQFTKAESDWGTIRKQWSWCLHSNDGERKLLIEPWLLESDEFEKLVELGSDRRMEINPSA